MAIVLTTKESQKSGGYSSINIWGQLRDDLRLIAAHTNRSLQDVGTELLSQAVAEVLPTVSPTNHGRVRNKKR
jgi:hypothetical protein